VESITVKKQRYKEYSVKSNELPKRVTEKRVLSLIIP
jgi:hypothetical protein